MTRTQLKQQWGKWFRRNRKATRQAKRRLFFEPMEARVLMTADQGGNSLGAAADIGTLNGTRQISDFVGQADLNDYYRVRLAERGALRLDLNGLSADADLQLLSSNGSTLTSSTLAGTSSELINRALEPGTYVIRVYRYSGNTNYRLTMTVTPDRPAIPDNAGNSLATARNLGTLTGIQSYTDFVGRQDSNDYYRFQIASRSTFELSLTELTADADVHLLNASGNTIASSTLSGSASESVRRTLDAGTYYVNVYVLPFLSDETNYRLTLSAQPEGAADGAGNSMGTARDLGTLRGSVTLQDFVGQADTADFYRFRIDSRSDFRLRMDGISADADVSLLDSRGQQIASSTNSGMNSEAVDRVLAAGDYVVQVFPYGNANTNYRLSLNVTAAQQTPTVTSIAGATSQSAGIQDGRVDMTVGTLWNGYRVVNDQSGMYPWTIQGTNFGAARGQVRLAGRDVPVLSWSNTSIRIDPTGSQINPGQPWNWGPQNAALVVTTAVGQSVTQQVEIVPAIRSRIYGQCTWHVARQRIEMGLAPSATPYGGYTRISASWEPRRGDQLQWGGAHTAIIETVSQPVVSRNVTTYTLTISQYNASGNNEPSVYTTTFQVTGRSVTAFPKFRDRGANATLFYR